MCFRICLFSLHIFTCPLYLLHFEVDSWYIGLACGILGLWLVVIFRFYEKKRYKWNEMDMNAYTYTCTIKIIHSHEAAQCYPYIIKYNPMWLSGTNTRLRNQCLYILLKCTVIVVTYNTFKYWCHVRVWHRSIHDQFVNCQAILNEIFREWSNTQRCVYNDTQIHFH